MTITTDAPRLQGWTASDDTFGARLALVRQHMGWGNVKEAALACGLPVQSWRGWERDNRIPRDIVSICQAVAAATGCDVHWLLGSDKGAHRLGEPLCSECAARDLNPEPADYVPHLRVAA